MRRKITAYVDVDIDLGDFSDDEIMQEVKVRGIAGPASDPDPRDEALEYIEHLLLRNQVQDALLCIERLLRPVDPGILAKWHAYRKQTQGAANA